MPLTRSHTIRHSLGLTALTAGAIALGALGASADASATVGQRSSSTQVATAMLAGTQPVGGQRQAPSPTSQRGFVLEGSGNGGGYSASVSLYANSAHGNVLGVSLEGPDGRLVVPAPADAEPATLFADGSIGAEARAITRDEEGEATPAGTIVVAGSYSESGKPARPNGAVRDDGEVVVVRGTNTPLSAQLTVTYGDVVIPVQVTNAFAFDLTVLAQEIGS